MGIRRVDVVADVDDQRADLRYRIESSRYFNLPGRFYPKGMKINVAGREVPVEKIGNRWDLYPP